MNAASILRNQSSRTTGFSTTSLNLSGMKTVMVGKDQHPVTIMQMAHVNDPAWKKAASFENLCNTAHSLLEAHNIADIMALVANEIPMDTGAAFQEAQSASKRITGDVFNIENLNPSAFLNSDGKNVKFTPTIRLSERPEDLTYFRFQCDLDGSELDRRVTTAGEFSFQFCLKFPKHLFHIEGNRVEELITSGRKRGQGGNMMDFMNDTGSYTSSPAKVLFQEKSDEHGYEGEFDYEEKSKDERVVNEEREAATPKISRGGSELTAVSPKFKGMFGDDDKNHKKGYYGPLTFFNTQQEFHEVRIVSESGNGVESDAPRIYTLER